MSSGGDHRFPPLHPGLRERLARVSPVRTSAKLVVYPCEVRLLDGSTVDRVYLAEAKPWFEVWGIWPDEDRGKSSLDIRQVADLWDSPTRIPPHLAEKPYLGNNGGMGGSLFALVFRDGSRLTVRSGDAHDFVDYPSGYGPADVVDIDCWLDRQTPYVTLPDYKWCIFE